MQRYCNKKYEEGREAWIDICKGIGILMVVLGHVERGYRSANIFENYNTFMKAFDSIIYSFHMPLFFVLSGYIFYMIYLANDQIIKLKRQIFNWGGVFVLFSVLQWMVKRVFGNGVVNEQYSWKDLFLFWIEPMAPYWYLWVLILFYILFWKIRNRSFKGILLICLLGAFLSHYIVFWRGLRDLLLYSFSFYMGICLVKYNILSQIKKGWYLIALVITLILVAFIGIHSVELLKIPLIGIISGTFIGLSVITAIRSYFDKNMLFSRIGKYSLEIYVMHCFITAPMRSICMMLGVRNFYLAIMLTTGVAMVIPIGIVVVLRKMHLYKVIFKPFDSWQKV